MLRLPWSTTAAAIGAIDTRDATVTTVGTMTAVTTMMAIADADIDTRTLRMVRSSTTTRGAAGGM
jgi:hypothetical protein